MNNPPFPPFPPCPALPPRLSGGHEPSVSLLLSALSWLTSGRRQPHDAAFRCAVAHHLYLLVRHPASDGTDIEAGFSMVNSAGLDACRLLSRFDARTIRMH